MQEIGTVKKNRNVNIDFIKFICAFGVICIHTQNDTFEAGLIVDFFLPLCVPFFLLSALVFFTSGLQKINLAETATKIWVRILIPYLSWTCIYSFLLIAKHYFTNQNTNSEWWSTLFYGGSAVQLYYIPKMLIMQLFSIAVVLILNIDNKRKLVGLVLFIISFVWLYYGVVNNRLGFSISDFVGISIYLILAFSIAKLNEKKHLTKIYTFVGLLLLLSIPFYGFLNLSFLNSYSNVFINIIGGLSLTLLAFTLPSFHFSPKVGHIFGYSYGIYLSHILFLEAFEFILKYFRIDLFFDLITKLLFSFSVLFCSILFVYLVKKNEILKRILIGE